eukprot:CAMPEP_0118907956 /NCGR_PEP_ID=MMETSP1166-20130328/11175_1 /TAXON_ID=1104430 /ORGANISM="Chrysoreinhardia sp, Strain CCMP3193" /LENGTH=346 /DNA_ID=CAMNT_0006847335 /DNA_START=38 /DNA_END=1078 /DNA_ORIENTATION=-
MARAYLGVDAELKACFVGSQEDKSVRWVCGRIDGEAVKLSATGKVAGSTAEDFDTLQAEARLTADEPGFVMFARDDDDDEGTRRWMLVAWVPDTAAPRLKMIYSSSREDLKSQLGAGYFGYKDYCANADADLAWSMVTHFELTDHDNRPLTEQEQLFLEEKKMEKDTSVKSNGMAAVPFQLSTDAREALRNTRDLALIEIALDDKDDSLLGLAKKTTSNVDSLPSALSTVSQPRFLLATEGADTTQKVVFIYFCPDDASLKHKMTYSTAKATFVDLAAANGVTIAKSIEVRDPDDLDAEFKAALAIDDSLDKREITHADLSKPARPGRARSATKPHKLKKKWSPDG